MNNPQLSYSAQITSPTQTQTIEAVQKTLSTQSELFNNGSISPYSQTLFNELQTLLNVWSNETNDFNELNVSMLAEVSKIAVSVSAAEKTIVSASDAIHGISIDWERFDKQQYIRNDDQLDLPIKIALETKRSVGELSLHCNQTNHITLTDNRTNITKIMNILGNTELTIDQFGIANLYYVTSRINPQDIKLNLKYCILFIGKVDIPFRENSLQMKLLRAMFGQQGRNHIELGFDKLYDICAKEENDYLSWESFCKIDGGKKKDDFIKQTRNNATAISNKVRKFIDWTEDFLEVKNYACRINPKLILKT